MIKDQLKPSSAMVRAALRTRYAPPAFALLEEVRSHLGHEASRSADAVAISMWPSRGIEILGIEIKVSRADWLGELKKPQKADEIAKFCDRWWLAVGDESVVKLPELPEPWGLLVLQGASLVVKKEAPLLTPETLSKVFVASLLRRVAQGLDKLRASTAFEAFERARSEVVPQQRQYELDRIQGELDDATQAIAGFEEATGVKLYNGKRVGQQFRRFMDLQTGYDPKPVDTLVRAADFLDRQATALREMGARLEQQRDVAQEGVAP